MHPIVPLFRLIYWIIGWKARPKYPKEVKKSICIVAPHTSNWDFVVLLIAQYILGMAGAKFLAKKELFDHPLGGLFRWLGGEPVNRSQRNSLVYQVVEKFNQREKLIITITPEGTRKYTEKWKSGFYHMAMEAKVPFTLGFVDFDKREVGIGKVVYPTGDFDADLQQLQEFYKDKYPFFPKNSNLKHPKASERKRWLNRIYTVIRLLFVVSVIYLIANFSTVVYGLQQGVGQLSILLKAQPIENVLEKENLPKAYREKIKLIQEIKQFTVEELGLDESDSYTSFYDQHGEPILWVITACEPYQLKAKRWDFPILGSFTYKGFFDKEKAYNTREALDTEGWDTRLGVVNAWSTLGILNDPILSNFLERDVGSLASLIIHELTHGTIFIKDNLSYNENLADFIGDEGAKLFLKKKYGTQSSEYLTYLNKKKDRTVFSNYVLQGAKRLDSLYNNMGEGMLEAEKKKLKTTLIQDICQYPDSLTFLTPYYQSYFDGYTPNNAFFIAYRTYREKQNQFKNQCNEEFGGNLKAFIAYMKEKNPSIF